MTKRLMLAILLAVLITACSSASVPKIQLAAPTQVIEATEAPAALSEASPAAEEPTETDLPADTAEPTETEPPAATDTAAPPTAIPPSAINPLTGLPASHASLLERRPMAIKVQMYPRGERPPWGISQADIVYDYYQNNGMTRLHAIFYGNDASQVGPIRSGRLFDATLVRMYKSILAFGGADKRILSKLMANDFSDRLILEGSHNCPPMCRTDPNGLNYLITNTDALARYAVSKGVKNNRQDLKGMTFQPAAPKNGQPGSQVFAHYSISSYTRWDYDSAGGRYLRFQDTQETNQGQGEGYAPLTDRLNKQQISAQNVVILFVPHDYLYKSQSGNSEIVEVKMSGTGKAVAFRDGQAYELTWSHLKNDDLFTLAFANGTPYAYKPGNTWYELMGKSTTVSKQTGGAWRFEMQFP